MNSNRPASAHLVGICGAGMRALAEVLMDLGWSLSGSDLLEAPKSIQNLINRGLLFVADTPPQTSSRLPNN